MLSLYDETSASTRVRLLQYADGLALEGHSCSVNFLLPSNGVLASLASNSASSRDLVRRSALALQISISYIRRFFVLARSSAFDIVVINCELLPLFPAWIERLFLRIPYVYDFDDAFYLKYREGRYEFLCPVLGDKIDRMISNAFAVTAGSPRLVQYASSFNDNVTLLPSCVDTDRYQPTALTTKYSNVDSITIGWIGSPTTAPYLQQLVRPLRQLALKIAVRFLVVGGPSPLIPGVEVIEVAWSLEREVSLIQQFDVGVMPLPDTPWTRGKCAYKLIQCMACGIPVVASRVGANFEALPPECGLLAESPAEWLAAFQRLVAEPDLRQRMGTAGRHWVEQRYSLRSALPVLTGVIQRVAASHPSR
jgi:glycosyltransferase involved in cell wall biosynthesis